MGAGRVNEAARPQGGVAARENTLRVGRIDRLGAVDREWRGYDRCARYDGQEVAVEVPRTGLVIMRGDGSITAPPPGPGAHRVVTAIADHGEAAEGIRDELVAGDHQAPIAGARRELKRILVAAPGRCCRRDGCD